MAQISRSVSDRCRKIALIEDEAPEKNDNESELIIKELVKKQTNTQTSLSEQLSLKKQFVRSSELAPLAKLKAGESSFECFSEHSRLVEFAHSLKRVNCSNDDIKMALDLLKGEKYFRNKHKILGADLVSQKIAALQAKIDEIKLLNVVGEAQCSNIGRHNKEILQSISAKSHSSKIVQFMQTNRSSDDLSLYPDDHPMNNLVDLEKEMFGHLKPTKSKRRKRKRKLQEEVSEPEAIAHVPTAEQKDADERLQISCLRQEGTLWDKKEIPTETVIRPNKPAIPETRVYTCAKQTWYTIKDNKPKFLGHKLPHKQSSTAEPKPRPGVPYVAPLAFSLVTISEIEQNRLSLSEIQQIDRFKNYEPGIPSKILFIKNLHRSVNECDLAGLFGNFEEPGKPRLVYRLMGGKMTGQAFINFPSTAQAQTALDCINGYRLKGKPIIIQFGTK